MKSGDEIELEFSELAFGGDAVARADDGLVVFASFLAPGDTARIRIERLKRDFAVGKTLELLSPGPDRIVPPCRYFGTCGGCQWQHVALSAQRAAKERIVRRLLAPMKLEDRVKPLRHGKEDYGYRHRLILPLRDGGGKLQAGFFRAQSHEVIEIDSCIIQHDALWQVARDAISLIRRLAIPAYDEAGHRGLLRHLLVRRAAGTGELGVILVSTRRDLPRVKELAEKLSGMHPALKGIGVSVNPRRGNVVMGKRLVGIHGDMALRERIGGLEFTVPFGAFFQANAEVTAIMLETVKSWTRDETEGILDIYCGVGILGIAAMTGSSASRLAGIEENAQAVAAARANAKANGIGRAEYAAGDAERVLPGMDCALKETGTAIVDPPRKGLATGVIRRINSLKVRRLIYVSCDPTTFARDLRGLANGGFRLVELIPMDMFPQTYHIELMARFDRN